MNQAAQAASSAGFALLDMLEQLMDQAMQDSGFTLSIAGAVLAVAALNFFKWYR